MSDDRCPDCGGRFDRPGLFHCDSARHPVPDLAERIVQAIETDLNDRRGMGFAGISEDTQYAIRDRWAELIRTEIRGAKI